MGQFIRKGNIIQISEKDIFDYVFQPEKLSIEKVKFIAQDKSLQDKVEYYREMKEFTGEAEPEERLLKKITEKIPSKSIKKPGKDKPGEKG